MGVYNFTKSDGSRGYAQDGEKFEEFLELLKELNDPDYKFTVQSWAAMAAALGISQTTIHKWRQSADAKKLTAKGLDYGLKMMTETGEKDWRMWREYLKINGMGDIEKTMNVDADGNAISKVQVEIINSKDDLKNIGDERSREDDSDGSNEENNM